MADLERLFNKGGDEFDFGIKIVGEVLKAHRDPVCVKSAWFAQQWRERFEKSNKSKSITGLFKSKVKSSNNPSGYDRVLDCADNPFLPFKAFFHWCYHSSYDCAPNNNAEYDFHREVYKVALRYGVPELMDLSLARFRASLNEPGAWKQRTFLNLLVDQWRGQHASAEPKELLGPPVEVLKAHIDHGAELGPHIQLRKLVANTPTLKAVIDGTTAQSDDTSQGPSRRARNFFGMGQDSSLRHLLEPSTEGSTGERSVSGRHDSSQGPSSFGERAEGRWSP